MSLHNNLLAARSLAAALVLGLVSTTIWAVPPGSNLANPGPYPIGYVTNQSISASGRSFAVDIYYPGTAAGSGASVASGQFPVVSFGHGWLQSTGSYSNLMGHLASWGLVVIAPRSQGGLFPNHGAFADDLNAALTWMVGQNTVSSSRFYGRVRTDKLGLSGHSMGGGAAVVAASRNNANVDTVGTMEAANTNPSAITAATSVTSPGLWIGGSSDSTASVSSHQRPMYNNKAPSKQLRIITSGSHTDGMNSGNAARQDLHQLLMTRWFLFYLADDTTLDGAVWGSEAQNTTGVSFEGVR
jgi:predicted dienelactone hydrolase